MNKSVIQQIITGLVLILAQAVVFDNICLFNVAVPMVFIYIIFKLPVLMNVNYVMTISFLTGLIIDMFADTYGMNALACTIAAGARRSVIRLYVARGEDLTGAIPSSRTFGKASYLKYLSTMTLLYCTLIFSIEAFTFFNLGLTVARILASTLLSVLLMLAIDSITTPRHEKRF